MALFRVTIADTKGHVHVKDVHSNNICGAKQQALLQMNAVYSGISHRNQDKSVVIRSVVKIDTSNT
jgi:hypothetical protein